MATLNVIFVLLNQGLFSLMPRALIITRLPCPFETFHYINGAVDYTAFSVWLISFRIMLIYVPGCYPFVSFNNFTLLEITKK